MVIRLAPLDAKLAAVEDERHLSPSEPAQMRCHRRGAGTRAAGKRDAGAAFPDAHAQFAAAARLDELDVGAGWEPGMMFDCGSELCDRSVLGVLDEQHAMRIADRDRRDIFERGLVESRHLERE